MAKFLMLGKYTTNSVKKISAERTKKVESLVKKLGGKIDCMYALLGQYDLAIIVDIPDVNKMVQLSVETTKITDIGFTTLPAIPVEEFDKLVGE